MIGNSIFNCIDHDQQQNGFLIIGGASNSTDIVSNANSPVIMKISEATGKLKWQQQLNAGTGVVSPQNLKECTIQQGIQNFIVAQSDNPQYSILVFRYDTGQLLKSFYEIDTSTQNIQLQKIPMGIFMNSQGQIYTISWRGIIIYIASFLFTSTSNTITSTVSKTFGSFINNEIGKSVAYISGLEQIFLGGNHNGQPIITKVQLSNIQWLYSKQLKGPGISTTQQYITKIGLFQKPDNTINQLVCVENLGTDLNKVAFVYFVESSMTVNTMTRSWYYPTTTKTQCLDVKLNNLNGYFIISQGGYNYYGLLNLASQSSTITVTKLTTSTSSLGQNTQNAYISILKSQVFYIVQTQFIIGSISIGSNVIIFRPIRMGVLCRVFQLSLKIIMVELVTKDIPLTKLLQGPIGLN
ncbi:UNKNOWN [Stylonychia lemnae]|uniref:Transmembrane protein n=1 Tax=Stylonychia lemnae TaxID=5949 RepID=A0A078AAD3_STYLE|nr:UNKNOWN [Stylonychia lemnae]|eukprot:CDW79149.1 UNKNOWN [Stylonychia lemnae]